MAEAGYIRENEQQSPARRQVGDVRPSSSQQPDQTHEADDNGAHDEQPKKRMREAAMVSESEDRAFKSRQYVEIRRFGRQRHGRGGKSGLAIKSSAGKACASQKVGDGFQTKVLTQTSALLYEDTP